MAIRDKLATFVIRIARLVGHKMGCYLVVEPSNHTVDISMEIPNQDKRAWDLDHYRFTNIFPRGYSNPVKIAVRSHKELGHPDVVDIIQTEETTQELPDGGQDVSHVELISSHRYREFMQQNLISQLINPTETLNKIIILLLAVLGVSGLIFIVMLFNTFG